MATNSDTGSNITETETTNFAFFKEKVKSLLKHGYTSIQFEANLEKQTQWLLYAGDYLLNSQEIREDSMIEYILIRYRQFLNLKHKIRNSKYWERSVFVPPPDVQFVWGIHQIRQEKYRSDLIKLFGSWFDELPYVDNNGEILKSLKQWNEEYPPSTYMPIFKTHQQYLDVHKSIINDVPLSIGVAEVKEELEYIRYYRENYPNYHDNTFIHECIEKYKKYLYEIAIQKYDGRTVDDLIGPEIDRDLVWHAHLQYGSTYDNDLMKNIGFIFYPPPTSKFGRINEEVDCDSVPTPPINTSNY